MAVRLDIQLRLSYVFKQSSRQDIQWLDAISCDALDYPRLRISSAWYRYWVQNLIFPDLENPKTFRDLSKPIGALSEKRFGSNILIIY